MNTADWDGHYHSALSRVAKARRVVIYCGAGVTLSRTGVGWRRLVLEIAEQLAYRLNRKEGALKDKGVTVPKNLIKRITSSELSPLVCATVVAELIYGLEKLDSEAISAQDKLAEYLTDILYTKSERRKSYSQNNTSLELLGFVSNTVAALIHGGKEVAVVTTNYDTYIEDELSTSLSNLYPILPDIDYDSMTSFETVRRKSLWKKNIVPLIYLHGRLPRASETRTRSRRKKLAKRVVFSESEYAESEKNVAAWLEAVTKEADVLLIVGSSMEDKPLIRLLQQNKSARDQYQTDVERKGESNQSYCKTVVLIKTLNQIAVTDKRLEEEELYDLVAFDDLRYSHLGINYYIPTQTYTDVADVLRDISLICQANTSDRSTLSQKREVLPFLSKQTLDEWCRCVSSNLEVESTVRRVFEVLASSEDEIRELFNALFTTDYKRSLVVRLELWLRGVAPYLGDCSQVVRVADSDSILLKADSRRSESLYRRFPSRTAAVRAMQFGCVQFDCLESFGEASSASRWQGFYVIPLTSTLGLKNKIISEYLTGAIVVSLGLRDTNVQLVSRGCRDRFQNEIKTISSKVAYVNADDAQATVFERIKVLLDSVWGRCESIVMPVSNGK